MSDKPWAYVAIKDGAFHGAITADAPPASVRDFVCEAVECGRDIIAARNRDEYQQMLRPPCPANDIDINVFGPGGDWDAAAHVRLLRAAGGASSGYTADLIERLYEAVLLIKRRHRDDR